MENYNDIKYNSGKKYNTFDNDIPKYKKKSNKPTTPKSKHKHQYEKAIIRYSIKNMGGYTSYSAISTCSICGKIGRAGDAWTDDELFDLWHSHKDKRSYYSDDGYIKEWNKGEIKRFTATSYSKKDIKPYKDI